MEFHPVSEIFPLMDEASLEKLAEDIKQNGQHEPIWVHSNGAIIDGRNRYRACQIAGVHPKTDQWSEEDHGSLLQFILGKNLHRRNLSKAQGAMSAARIADFKRGNRDTQICASYTIKKAANIFGVSERSVNSAKKLIEAGIPELIELVETGQVSIAAAECVAGRQEAERNQIVAKGSEEIKAAASRIRAASKAEKQASLGNEPEDDESGADPGIDLGDPSESETSGAPEINGPGSSMAPPPHTTEPGVEVQAGEYPVIIAEPPWNMRSTPAPSDNEAGGPEPLELSEIKERLLHHVEHLAHNNAAILFRTGFNFHSDARKMLDQHDFDHLLSIPVSNRVSGCGNGINHPLREYVLLGLRGDIAGLDLMGLIRWLDDRRLEKESAPFSIQELARQLSKGPTPEVCWNGTAEEVCHGE